MAGRAANRGSGDGIHRAILEANLRETGRSRPDVGNATFGTSLVQSRAAGAQARLSRRRAFSEAARIARTNLEFRARCRTTPVADTHAHAVSTDTGQSTAAESTRGTARRSPYQVVQFGFRPTGRQCTTDAEGTSGRR